MLLQGAVRSEWLALYKDWNTAIASPKDSRRASQEALIRYVMPLGKGATIPSEPCLAAKRFLAR